MANSGFGSNFDPTIRMPPQYSTSVSDGALAVAALTACYTVFPISIAAAVGFSTIAAAASLGAVRFFRNNPSEGHIRCHKYMTLLSISFGLPLIATAYLRQWSPLVGNILLATAISIFALERSAQFVEVARLGGKVIGPVAMLSILAYSIMHFNGCGIVGVALFAVAALAVKTEGEIYGLKRVDVFHYVLVVAIIALMKGLEATTGLPDIYYKSE